MSRSLAADTIEGRLGTVRRFQRFANDWSWSWRPVDVEEFSAEARGRGRARSTMRGDQCALCLFCEYVAGPRYQWAAVCQRQFGAHPAQICFAGNTASHTWDREGDPGRRALTKRGLQELLDYADERVVEARWLGRKGWLTALRDAAALKVCYVYGLRR